MSSTSNIEKYLEKFWILGAIYTVLDFVRKGFFEFFNILAVSSTCCPNVEQCSSLFAFLRIVEMEWKFVGHGNLFVRTPLMLATSYGHVETLKYLIGAGAEVHALDNFHRTCLHMSVSRTLFICVFLFLIWAWIPLFWCWSQTFFVTEQQASFLDQQYIWVFWFFNRKISCLNVYIIFVKILVFLVFPLCAGC